MQKDPTITRDKYRENFYEDAEALARLTIMMEQYIEEDTEMRELILERFLLKWSDWRNSQGEGGLTFDGVLDANDESIAYFNAYLVYHESKDRVTREEWE